MRRIAFAFAVVLAGAAQADDVWLVSGIAYSPTNECTWTFIAAGADVHNPTDAPIVVRFLDSTTELTGGATFSIPPHRTASLPLPFGKSVFDMNNTLVVTHLDVPHELAIHADLEFGVVTQCTDPPPGIGFDDRGNVRMPVFRELTAAGTPSVHVHTTLNGVDARLNVGIYNAGDVNATAIVEILGWDDGVVAEKRFTIPPRSVGQQTVVPRILDLIRLPPKIKPLAPPGMLSTRVTVDQPGLSFVSVLSNTDLPQALVTVSE